MVGHETTDWTDRLDLATAGIDIADELEPFDYEQYHRELEVAFVEYLREEAAHTLSWESRGIMGVIRDAQHMIARSGFETAPDKGEPRLSAFVPAAIADDIDGKADHGYVTIDTDRSPPKRSAHGTRILGSDALDDTVIVVHHDTILPVRVGTSWKPWLVRYPEAVAVAEVDA